MYEFLAQLAQTWGLLIFVIAFVLVLIYALSPGNAKQFDHARRIPLEEDKEDQHDENRI